MKTVLKIAALAGFAALAACGSHNSANNEATDLNSTDMNASVGDLNGLNAADLNATGSTDLNAGNVIANNAVSNGY